MTVLHPLYPYPPGTPWQQPGAGRLGRGVPVPKQSIRRKGRFTLFAVGLLCVSAFPCFGHRHPARQSECKSTLKSLFTHVRTAAPERFEARGIRPTLDRVGFSPERGNRYAYFLGPGPMEDRSGVDAVTVPGQLGIGVDTFKFPDHPALTFSALPPEIAGQVGIKFNGSFYDFTAACAGDIDNNVTDSPDVWTISSRDRMINGEHIMAGEPYYHVNDMTSR